MEINPALRRAHNERQPNERNHAQSLEQRCHWAANRAFQDRYQNIPPRIWSAPPSLRHAKPRKSHDNVQPPGFIPIAHQRLQALRKKRF